MFSDDISTRQTLLQSKKKKATNKCQESNLLKRKRNQTTENPKQLQLFLDFGQKSFGKHRCCPDCAFFFIQGDDEEEREHKKFCKKLRLGIPFSGWKTERLVKRFSDGAKIIQVRPTDPHAHRVKVAEVHAVMDKEMGFAEGQEERTAFLYLKSNRIIACATAEELQAAYVLKKNQPNNRNPKKAGGIKTEGEESHIKKEVRCRVDISASKVLPGACEQEEKLEMSKQSLFCEPNPTPAHIGIHQIWVNKAHRRQGIASKLVEAIRQNMRFGFVAKKSEIAFSQPTFQGLKFAHSYMGGNDKRLLIY